MRKKFNYENYYKKYYESHKDKHLYYVNEWKKKHKDSVRIYSKRYSKSWRLRNKERLKKTSKRYYDRHIRSSWFDRIFGFKCKVCGKRYKDKKALGGHTTYCKRKRIELINIC